MDEAARAAVDGLVIRARRDADALGELYERHYPAVLRYCVHRLFCRDAAEDATSEVFLRVAKHIGSFPGRTERDFVNWLYAIATNEANAVIRRSKRRRELLEAAVQQKRIHLAESTPQPDGVLDWPTLYEVIALLPQRDQALITLRSFEQLPFEQVAEICGMKTATARVGFTRALGKLQKRLTSTDGRGS